MFDQSFQRKTLSGVQKNKLAATQFVFVQIKGIKFHNNPIILHPGHGDYTFKINFNITTLFKNGFKTCYLHSWRHGLVSVFKLLQDIPLC